MFSLSDLSVFDFLNIDAWMVKLFFSFSSSCVWQLHGTCLLNTVNRAGISVCWFFSAQFLWLLHLPILKASMLLLWSLFRKFKHTDSFRHINLLGLLHLPILTKHCQILVLRFVVQFAFMYTHAPKTLYMDTFKKDLIVLQLEFKFVCGNSTKPANYAPWRKFPPVDSIRHSTYLL